MSTTTGSEKRSTARCAECEAPLVHDQRYCLECGARRGPLPPQIAEMVGAIREQGPAAASAPVPTGDGRRPRAEFALPGPRAAAAAVMGMLGFGVIIGSLAGGASVETLASAPLIVVGLAHTTPAPPVVQSAPGGQDGGSAGAAAPTSAAASAPAQTAAAAASPAGSTTPVGTGTSPATGFNGLPPVKHVFLIVLSDRGFRKSFGAGAAGGYLAGALRRQGELVQNYYGVAGAPLANEIALVSGQGPTAETAADCPVFSRVKPGHKGARGQVLGTGCAYPPTTKTLAGQLSGAGGTWKAYVQGASGTACRVPKLGSDVAQTAGAHENYLAWRNPFVYFRSLTSGAACRHDEVGLNRLATDLHSASTTPSLAYVIPATCADGSEAACRPGATPSLAAANHFLKTVVPEIKRSPAYKSDGLIAITFDQAPQSGQDADPSACCSNPTYPNLSRLPAGMPAVPPGAMGPGTTTTTTTGTGTSTTDTGTTGTTTTDTGTTTSGTTGTTTTDTGTTTTGTGTTDTGATTTGTGTTTTGTTGTGTTTTGTTTTTPSTSLGSGVTTPTGGGGQVGLLLISPYVKPGSIDVVDYFNHFSLLASIENLFGLHRLGYAGVPGLPVFSTGVFNNYAG